jgi:hypothetical protein
MLGWENIIVRLMARLLNSSQIQLHLSLRFMIHALSVYAISHLKSCGLPQEFSAFHATLSLRDLETVALPPPFQFFPSWSRRLSSFNTLPISM